jgi:hypothetical protein
MKAFVDRMAGRPSSRVDVVALAGQATKCIQITNHFRARSVRLVWSIPGLVSALFGTTYFQLLHKFKQKFCQTDSFCSSLSVQLLLKMN